MVLSAVEARLKLSEQKIQAGASSEYLTSFEFLSVIPTSLAPNLEQVLNNYEICLKVKTKGLHSERRKQEIKLNMQNY